tara:strand:- start:1558 stop:2046 length:489 start_codon:yes stop_codon:yes gene_type:complete
MKKRESILWQKIKKACPKIHFTRIESKTINGIPDLNGCMASKEFWLELKSDFVGYPKLSKWQISWINKRLAAGGTVLICNETLKERSLKLYRPLSAITDARLLKPRFSFSFPVQWAILQDAIWELLDLRAARARSRAMKQHQRFVVDVASGGSVSELDLARD